MSWQRILAAAPRTDERNGASYHEVACRTLLNPVRAPELPFDLSLNPYLNCEVGCSYCYARDFTSKRQGGADLPGSFERQIYAKEGAEAVLRRELARLRRAGRPGRPIALGTATDPYQPLEKRRRLTRALLEVMAEAGGVNLSVTTKSDLVLRDLDLLQEIGRRGRVQVNVTVTTVDPELARSMEPRAPTPQKRLRAVESLARAGVPVGVLCMPVLPDITCSTRDLRRLVCAAKQAGAGFLASRVLTLRRGVRQAFFTWLEQARPELVPRYVRMYSRGPSAPGAVVERIEQAVTALRRQYRLPAALALPDVPVAPVQMELFDAAPARAAPRLPRLLPRAAGAAAAPRSTTDAAVAAGPAGDAGPGRRPAPSWPGAA